jgi:hypothetical protein
MRKVLFFLKHNWVIIMVVLAIVLTVANKLIKGPMPNPTASPSSTPSGIADYLSIIPGKSNLDDAHKSLGSSLKQTEIDGLTIVDFASSSKYRNNQVFVQNEVVVLIKEIVTSADKKYSQDITSHFGTAPYKLYEQAPQSAFDLYVFPDNGIAYLGGKDGKTVLEIWYFEPTTIENFLSRWGKGFASTPTKESNPY